MFTLHDAVMTDENNILPENKPDPAAENRVPDEPIINVPPCTLVLLLFMAFIYLLQIFMSESAYEDAVIMLAFIPERLTTAGSRDIFAYFTLVTHMFLHGNSLHILMNGAMLLAIGSGVEKIIGKMRYILFFFICGIASVLIQYSADIHGVEPLIGASGGISGLFGGIMIYMYKKGRMSRGIRGLFSIVAVWTFVNILLGFIGIPGDDTVSVAWIAHLGGFYSGLLLFPYFLKRI